MFEIWQDGQRVASSTSEPDARHYALMYAQDGGTTELRKREGRKSTVLMRWAELPNVPLARG